MGGGGWRADSTQVERIWSSFQRQKVERGLLLLIHFLWFQPSVIFCHKSTEPEFLVLSWRYKPEVTSGQFRILPMLQLLLTRTNQNKPELCRCGLSPGFVWGQEWQNILLNTQIWLCEEGGKVNSNHIKIVAFQLMIIIL